MNEQQATKVVLWVVGLLIGLPLLLYGCLWGGMIGMLVVNDFVNSGSATGNAAILRAHKLLGDVDAGKWRKMVTNAKAEWTAPAFNGDRSEYVAFDLPVQYIAEFEAAIKTEWSTDHNFSGPHTIEYLPDAKDLDWSEESLEDGVSYQRGFDNISISRKTGHVIFKYIQS